MKRIKTILALIIVAVVLTLQYAAESFGQTNDRYSVESLIDDLKDESWQIRWHAAETLGEKKDPRALEPLIDVLKDKNSYVRAMAAWALGEMKDPCAIEPLIHALKDKDPNVQKRAALALGEITGKNFGKDPAKWQKWWEKNKSALQRK